jgi:tetratricopeptide (TPR) repeat protein
MTFSQKINDLFEREKWAKAGRLLEQRLAKEPHNHWLLTRLGTTYYEQRDYQKALELTQEAHQLAPNCPLVLFDLASSLEMLGDDAQAVKTYAKLFQKGVKGIAEEECGEGVPWARSLLADCLYSVAGCLHRLGDRQKALGFMQQYLEWRAMGVKSIYSRKEVRERLREIADPSLGDVFEQETGEAGKKLELV